MAAALRGLGVVVRKSAAFSFVSVQPPVLRRAAVTLLGAGVRPEPSKQSAVGPYPTKSATDPASGQPPPADADVPGTSATLARADAHLRFPGAAGAGRG